MEKSKTIICIALISAFIIIFRPSAFAKMEGKALEDSLLKELPKQKEDTNKVKLFLSLHSCYIYSNVDEAIKYNKMALTHAGQLNWDKGKARAMLSLGWDYWKKMDYTTAMKYGDDALALYQKLADAKKIGDSYRFIGQDYIAFGNFSEALKYLSLAINSYKEAGSKYNMADTYVLSAWVYNELGKYPEVGKCTYAALKIYEEIGDKHGIGLCYSNMAANSEHDKHYDEALKYLKFGIKECERSGDLANVAVGYMNIAGLYSSMGNYPVSLKYYDTTLTQFKKLKHWNYMADTYMGFGDVYEKQNNFTAALKCYLEADSLFKTQLNQIRLAEAYSKTADCYIKLNKTTEAQKIFKVAFSLTKDLKSVSYFANYYQDITSLDSATGNWKGAYEDHKLYLRYRDSAYNEENTKKIVQAQMQYDFDKKEAATKTEQDKKDIQERNIRNSIAGGLGGVLIFSIVVYRQRNRVKKEKKRSDELLLNILPEEVAEELKAKGEANAKMIDEVTVLFTDFKGFTSISEKMSAEELVHDLNECFSAFDHIMEKHHMEKIKTIGDSYMAAGGLPTPNNTHAGDAVKAALEIAKFIEDGKAKKIAANSPYFEIRIGIHTGPVVAGIVGIKKFQYDIWGDTVNTASRMESSGEAGKVNISGATYELVKDKFTCTHRGKIEAKGKGEVDMYFVEGVV